MSDEQRGAYTPSQEIPLEFDPRRPSGRRPAPVALLASGAVLALVVVGGALVYSRGVRGENEPPRPVGEPIAQLKTSPAAGAQPQDGDVDVSAPQNVPAKVPVFAPPPELPRPRPTAETPRLRIVTDEAAAPAVKAQEKAAVKSAELPPPPPAPPAKPLALAAATPVPVRAATAMPYPGTAASALGRSEALAAQTPQKPAPTPTASASAAGTVPVQVQIGAFSSAGLADKGWSDVAALLPGSIGGKGKHVEKVDRNGQTLYRTSVTGFATRETASAFCDALKAKGKICFVKS